MKKGILLLIAGLAVISFTACENQFNSDDPVSDELTIAELEVSALKSAESVGEEIDAARFAAHFQGMTSQKAIVPRDYFDKNFPDCATVTVEGEDYPKTITIDYGDNCITRGGMSKSGTVTITMSDSLSTPGATYTVEFEDLVMGRGVKNLDATYTYEGINEAGNHVMSWTAESSTLINDSILIERTVSHTREWLDGFDTRYISDDKFLLSGSGTITINGTNTFTREITDPLFFDRACNFILSGVVEISKNEEVMYIDFGDGECDNIAVVTKDGVSEEIELNNECFREGFKRHNRNMNKNKGWW